MRDKKRLIFSLSLSLFPFPGNRRSVSCNTPFRLYRASTITVHDRSACHDTKHKHGHRLSSLDMQIPVITITNRAQADIMESRDCNVRNRHIRDTRTNQRTDSPPLSLPLPSLSLPSSVRMYVCMYMHRQGSP